MGKDNPLTVSVVEIYPNSRGSSCQDVSSVQNGEKDRHPIRDEEDAVTEYTVSDDSESETKPDPNTITWDGPDDPANPKNWTLRRKWTVTIIVSAYAFISPLSSSMVAPALDQVGNELHIPHGIQLELVLSIFLLAYSFGPFVLSPSSEIWGRVSILRNGNLMFIAFNLACGFARTKGELMAFRFLSGLGGSATVGMGSGILADCWRAEERGKGQSVYQLAPVLGPAIGPIVGGIIAQHTTWRWAFWSITCFNAAIQLAGFFFLQETYAPKILAMKADRLRKQTGNMALQTQWESEGRTLSYLLRISLTRPWRFLGTQPIVQMLALYQAYNFGMLYLFISSFPALWAGRYGMPMAKASLNYLSLAVGSLAGAQLCGPCQDRIYRHLLQRSGPDSNKRTGPPEYRVPLMIPASVITPCGVLLYGWSAQAKLHWIFPNIGAALFAFGSMISFQCIQLYLVDTYTRYAASASAATAFLRSLAAFGFPLFAPYLFRQVGYGLGGSVLAVLAVVLGVPAPWLLWRYGEALRRRSQFAAG